MEDILVADLKNNNFKYNFFDYKKSHFTKGLSLFFKSKWIHVHANNQIFIIIITILSCIFFKKCDKYDIIFADPPYGIGNLILLVDLACKKLNPGGVFILECSKNESLAGYYKSSKFGDTQLLYWKA